MCFDAAALPPAPPVTTGPADGSELVLTSAHGATFAAYLAQPANPIGKRLVLLPDVGGLSTFYRELALRFAEAGLITLAIDYYGRTAGAGRRAELDVDLHSSQLSRENLLSDIRAALAWQQAQGSEPVFIIGFCIGGATAMHAGTTDMDFTGVIAFCPWKGAVGVDDELPDDFVADIRRPVLGLFGGADNAVPIRVPHAFRRHLAAAGVPHEIVIYPGEPHGFFERDHDGEPGHADAAADAWSKLLNFVSR